MLHMHMTYKTVLKGTARIALSCLTLLGAMLLVACVYEQIPEAYDEAEPTSTSILLPPPGFTPSP